MPVRTDDFTYKMGLWAAGHNQSPNPVNEVRYRNINVHNQRITAGDLPGWRDRLALGYPCTTALEGTRHRRVMKYGDAHWALPEFQQDTHLSGVLLCQMVDVPDPPSTVSSLLTIADNLAIADFVKNFRSKTRVFQTGPFVGELGEVARQLASPVKSLRKSIGNLSEDMLNHLRRPPFRKYWASSYKPVSRAANLRSLTKTLGDTWLEWQFGIKPTLSDIEDATKAFRKLAQGRTYDIVRIRGEGRAEDSRSFGGQSVSFGSFSELVMPSCSCYVDSYWKVDVRYLFGWKVGTPSGEMPAPMTLGLTLSDFVPTIWELIPYSWLVDYFTNIGDVLDAWSLQMVQPAWGQKTVHRTGRNRAHSISPASAQTSSAGGGQVELSKTFVSRSEQLSFPVPGFDFRLPGIGSTKWLNLAAFGAARSENRRLAARL